ncbi:MAG: lipocalin-like domain-containing protein [Actinomycetota bacterium]|nr:lipocalin-like domain-containing protein [Actinomycetota bacterium]
MSASAEQASALLGHWSLVAWTGEVEGGEHVAHGGDDPRGDLIYLPSGRMTVQIQPAGRARFGSRELDAGTATERAIAYSTYNAYCGTFTVPEPGVVVHTSSSRSIPISRGWTSGASSSSTATS